MVSLLRSPAEIFEPRYGLLWVEGAAGAFLVFLTAFLLNQLVGRGFLRLLRSRPMPWPRALPAPTAATSLLAFPSGRPEAFSFTLVEAGGPRLVRRREVILLSSALLERLAPVEVEAAVAHEIGHIRGLDSRYLTFLRTLARLMRWDPLLAYLAYSLTRREELRADLEAVAITRNPLALARALYKVSTSAPAPPGSVAFLGASGARGRREALERIRRLIALADSGAFDPPEGPGG